MPRDLRAIVRRHLRSPPSAYLSRPEQVLMTQNVVAGVNLGVLPRALVLNYLASAAQIDFTGMPFRTSPPNATHLVFSTGAVQCSGTKSQAAAFYSLQQARYILQELGLRCEFKDVHVDNVVASGSVLHAVAVERMEYEDAIGICWTPETFPGALYFAPNMATALIFDTGEVLGVGISDEEKIESINEHLMTLLRRQLTDARHHVAHKSVARRTKQQQQRRHAELEQRLVSLALDDVPAVAAPDVVAAAAGKSGSRNPQAMVLGAAKLLRQANVTTLAEARAVIAKAMAEQQSKKKARV